MPTVGHTRTTFPYRGIAPGASEGHKCPAALTRRRPYLLHTALIRRSTLSGRNASDVLTSSTRRSISGVLPDVVGSLHCFDPEAFAARFSFDLRWDMRLCSVIMETGSVLCGQERQGEQGFNAAA